MLSASTNGICQLHVRSTQHCRISTVVSGEHSRSKTNAIIAMYDVSTTRVFVRYKTVAVAMSLYDITIEYTEEF